jgi:hypothetical protein
MSLAHLTHYLNFGSQSKPRNEKTGEYYQTFKLLMSHTRTKLIVDNIDTQKSPQNNAKDSNNSKKSKKLSPLNNTTNNTTNITTNNTKNQLNEFVIGAYVAPTPIPEINCRRDFSNQDCDCGCAIIYTPTQNSSNNTINNTTDNTQDSSNPTPINMQINNTNNNNNNNNTHNVVSPSHTTSTTTTTIKQNLAIDILTQNFQSFSVMPIQPTQVAKQYHMGQFVSFISTDRKITRICSLFSVLDERPVKITSAVR